MRILMTLLAAAFVGLAATPTTAGSIGDTPVDGDLDWRTDCDEPIAPKLFMDDIESYNRSLAQFNAYVTRVRAFINCVQRDGQADIDAMGAAIAKRMQETQKAAIAATENLRTDLEVQRQLLR